MSGNPSRYIAVTANQIRVLCEVERAAGEFDPTKVKYDLRNAYRGLLRKGLVAQGMSGLRAKLTDAGGAKLVALRAILKVPVLEGSDA